MPAPCAAMMARLQQSRRLRSRRRACSPGSAPSSMRSRRRGRGTRDQIAPHLSRDAAICSIRIPPSASAPRAKCSAQIPATPMVVLGTAHPAKFPAAVEQATGIRPALPARLAGLCDGRERFDVLPNDQRRQSQDYIRDARSGRAFSCVTDMSVEITTLPSGLRIATDRMPHLETAALGVCVGAGSRHESERRARPVASARAHGVQGHAAALGARTSPRRSRTSAAISTPRPATEQTAYYARVLAEDVPLALDILADILTEIDVRPRRSSNARKA